MCLSGSRQQPSLSAALSSVLDFLSVCRCVGYCVCYCVSHGVLPAARCPCAVATAVPRSDAVGIRHVFCTSNMHISTCPCNDCMIRRRQRAGGCVCVHVIQPWLMCALGHQCLSAGEGHACMLNCPRACTPARHCTTFVAVGGSALQPSPSRHPPRLNPLALLLYNL